MILVQRKSLSISLTKTTKSLISQTENMQTQQPTLRLFVETALSFVGCPSIKYIRPDSGKDLSGFDCSGFIVHVLNATGILLPANIRHCNEFFDSFGVHIHDQCKRPGDLIFFSRNGQRPTHIGVVVDHNHYIHAPGETGSKICIEEFSHATIPPRSEQLYTKNPIGFKRISIPAGRWQKLLK